jgi:cobalt-zinc-cadmium efflux system membrane fusion protein
MSMIAQTRRTRPAPRSLLRLAVVLLAGAAGCDGGAPPDVHGTADEHADDEHAEHTGHAGEVRLAPDTLAAEGIAVAPATERVLQPTMRVPARVAFDAERMAHVGSPVRGRVAEVLVRIGDEVELGQARLVVDSPELGEAQSAFLQELSSLAAAGPVVDLARTSFERGRTLHEDGQGLPLAEVQRREAELRAAEAARATAATAVQAARSRLLLLGMSAEAVERVAESGTLDARATVRAPLAGQVIEREVTLGELVNPEREELLVLADTSRLWVLADVPEGRIALVRAGASARVLFGSDGDHWCEGKVVLVSPAVDPATRTVRVRIEADERHSELRPGVFAQAEIAVGGDTAPVLAVPQSAVLLVDGAPAVFVAVPGEPGTFARRSVLTGPAAGGFVPVLAGLEPGEEVAVSGAFLLKAELGKGDAEHAH